MKKFLVFLSIGTLITSALAIPSFSLASKERIQAYASASSKYNSRRYTNRIGPFHYRRQLAIKKESQDVSFWSRFAQQSRRTSSYRPIISRRSVSKDYHPQLITDDRFQTLDVEDYLITLPSSFKGNKKNDSFKHSKMPLSFRITRTPEDYKCTQSFALCAIALDKDFKNKQEISSSYSHKIRYQQKQTRAHDFRSYPTFIESFKAMLFGQENVYFLFSTHDPKDNSIIRIEAVANAAYEQESAKIMHQVFETFRF